jgi:hypothetical protein
MPRSIAVRGLGLLLFVSLAFTPTARGESQQEAEQDTWFKRFYQTQDLKPFGGFWSEVVSQKLLEQDERISPIIGFASQVFHQHPELLKGRIESVAAFPEKQQEAIRSLLWLSDSGEARKILQADSPGKSMSALPAIKDWKIERAEDLDLCWGWFFATGETKALDPIISALEFGKYAGALKRFPQSGKTEEDKAAAYKDAVFVAAMWSLEANAKEDPRIAEHIEKVFDDPTVPRSRGMWLAVLLSKIMPLKYEIDFKSGGMEVQRKGADKPQNTVDEFMALVVVTSDADWRTKWDTPAHTTPKFTSVSKLKIGERATVLIFFSNPRSDSTSGVNVTCDIKTIRPNGKVTETKGLPGCTGVLQGVPTNMFLTKSVVGFLGDKDDPLGEWRFEIVVHDNVRKVSVPVATRFVLEKP